MSNFTFDEDTHTYRLDGHVIPGVSSISGLSDDFAGIPREVLERKTAIGKAVHAAADIINKGQIINTKTLHEAVVPYVDAYHAFFDQCVKRVISSERLVYSHTLRFAGQLDLEYETFTGLEVLTDVKTVGQIRATTKLQTAGYAILSRPDFLDRRSLRRSAIQLKPNGSFHEHIYDSLDDERAFLGLLSFYNWSKKQ